MTTPDLKVGVSFKYSSKIYKILALDPITNRFTITNPWNNQPQTIGEWELNNMFNDGSIVIVTDSYSEYDPNYDISLGGTPPKKQVRLIN